MTRDEIEADLAEDLDLEQLAVYGDFLQGEGDPRGELIAIDLDGRDLAGTREGIVDRWLGPRLAGLIGRDAIDLGFVDLRISDDVASRDLLDTWVATPAAHYVRSATISGATASVTRAARAIAKYSGRWLAQLAIRITGLAGLDDADWRCIADATPHLERLELWGERVIGDLGHPRVKALRITGTDAAWSLLGDGPAHFPKVGVLDLAFDRRAVDPDPFKRARLPMLRRLDLSSNEPGRFGPHNFGGAVDPFWVLGTLPLREQLAHVRLPSVRSRAQAERLAWALARMPLLRGAELARNYEDFKFLVPETVKAPSPYPWPPADQAVRLSIRIANTPVPAAPLLVWLEENFSELPETARNAWLVLCRRMRERDELVELPYPVVYDALAPLEGGGDLAEWVRVRQQIRDEPKLRIYGTIYEPDFG